MLSSSQNNISLNCYRCVGRFLVTHSNEQDPLFQCVSIRKAMDQDLSFILEKIRAQPVTESGPSQIIPYYMAQPETSAFPFSTFYWWDNVSFLLFFYITYGAMTFVYLFLNINFSVLSNKVRFNLSFIYNIWNLLSNWKLS